jgi:fructose-bisphosphate aldolase class II
LDFDLIRDISKHVSQPLVLHGSSGVSDEDLQRAVKAGMSKINIATHLNNVFTSAIRNALAKDLQVVDPRKYLIPSRQLLSDEVSRLLKLLATP